MVMEIQLYRMGDELSDNENNFVHRRLNTDRAEPAVEVAEIIADLKGTEESDLSAIYNTVDHVLTHLFDNPPSPEAQVEVQFHYEGFQITVHQHGNATFLNIN